MLTVVVKIKFPGMRLRKLSEIGKKPDVSVTTPKKSTPSHTSNDSASDAASDEPSSSRKRLKKLGEMSVDQLSAKKSRRGSLAVLAAKTRVSRPQASPPSSSIGSPPPRPTDVMDYYSDTPLSDFIASGNEESEDDDPGFYYRVDELLTAKEERDIQSTLSPGSCFGTYIEFLIAALITAHENPRGRPSPELLAKHKATVSYYMHMFINQLHEHSQF